MSEENRIRFAGLMEEYLNIPSFVCELIEKKLEDNKYKEVIEYVVQRRNEIENKEDYLSEQEKIKRYLDLQQKVEQLEKQNEYLKMSNPEQNMEHFRIVNENKRKIDMLRKENHQLENIRKEAIEYVLKNKLYRFKYDDEELFEITTDKKAKDDLLNILNKGDNKDE